MSNLEIEKTADGDWAWCDRDNRPPDDILPESHQVWVWMRGPDYPHWEVRGTGVIFDV